MTASNQTGNPWVDSWMESWTKMQSEFASVQEAMSQSAQSAGVSTGAFEFLNTDWNNQWPDSAKEFWDLYRQQADDWIATSRNFAQADDDVDSGNDATAAEALRRMMDPAQFLNGGFDEVSHALRQLVEGPELADLGTLEREVLKAGKEWVAFQNAGDGYRKVVASAWQRAFDKFSESMRENPSLAAQGTRAVLDHWLQIANQELILTQRTEEFLEAQRLFLRTGIEYRIKQRELIEVWCEIYSIPTRTEVDDVHKTLYELRRKVRSQERRIADLESARKQGSVTQGDIT